MKRQTERIALDFTAPGTARSLTIHRYGAPQARPKAYLQAALHADETPGLLVLHHLARLLDGAAGRGEVTGHIVLVPYANPIGLDQIVNRRINGRYDLAGGGNFNRRWPSLDAALAERLAGRLSADPTQNVALVRDAMREELAGRSVADALDGLRLTLAREAADADLVLDLHCDDEALMHLYLNPAHWPDARDLATELDCRAVLLAEDSGGGSFDEAFAAPFTRLARHFPEHPIPPACLSATVELRGQPDVSDALAERDAGALFRVLQRRGLVAGDAGPLPEPACEATALDACDVIAAPAAGVLAYAVDLGQRVQEGDTVAWLIDPAAEDPGAARREITARTDGLVLSRRVHKYVAAGLTVAKVVGTRPLPWRTEGLLLVD